MRRIALTYRLALVAALVFAANGKAREKARHTMRLFDEVFGKRKPIERMKSVGLVATGAVELARIWAARLRGRDGIVRQPPCKRTEYTRMFDAAVPTPDRAVSPFSLPVPFEMVPAENEA